MSKRIANIVNKLRVERDLTQAELATKSGLDSSYMSHLISGRRRFNEDIIYQLAKALEVHPSTFFMDLNIEKPLRVAAMSEGQVKQLVQDIQKEFGKDDSLSMGELREAIKIGLEVRRTLHKGSGKKSKKHAR